MIRFVLKSALTLALIGLALYHFKVRIDDGKVIVERRGERERRQIERTVEKVSAQAKELEVELRATPAAAADASDAAAARSKAAAADHIPEADREALADLLEESP